MGGNSLARVRKPARLRAESNGFGVPERYVPASLDEILSLSQCASWLQQPESVLRELIGKGTLKPLPLPGADYRLHARTVLLQMGIAGEALGNHSSATTTTNNPAGGANNSRVSKMGKGLLYRHAPDSDSHADDGSTDEVEPRRKQSVGTGISTSTTQKVESRPPRNPEPKETIIRRCYESHGRKVEVTVRLGDSARHRLAESNLLDVVVSSLKPGRN